MSLPPPPPPPPLLSPPAKSQSCGGGTPDRGALLSAIRQGAKLKKATTNDRSTPIINGKSPSQSSSSKSEPPQPVSSSLHSGPTPMGLGGLFAQGMPKLRSTNQPFLKGGTYKSQLNPRPSINSDSLLKKPSHSFDKQNDDFEDETSVKNMSSKNQDFNTAIKSSKLFQNNQKSFVSDELQDSRPLPPSNPKPNFQSRSLMSSHLVKSCDFPLGGSEPNLSIDSSKPRASSKPMPPPKLSKISNLSSPVKSSGDVKQRSYEDTDIPAKPLVKNGIGKPNSFTLGPRMHSNRSEPSNLDKIAQNGLSQQPVAPMRQHNRRLVKPTTAPPPLPNRTQTNGSQNNVQQSSKTARDPPPAPPSMPPPPPPPRVLQQNITDGRMPQSLPRNMPVRNGTLQRSPDSPNFESRFKFHKLPELPRPDFYPNSKKIYCSKLAKERPQQRRRPRQAPLAPPPPPPK